MELGINTVLWNGFFKRQGRSFDIHEFLAGAKEAGYDAVEIRGLWQWFDSPEQAAAAIADAGLRICAWSQGVTLNPYEPNITEYRKGFAWAQALGLDTITTCGGFPPERLPEHPASDYDLFADSLGPAVDLASEHGLQLCFHPHRGCVVETADEMQQMVDRVPALRINVDIAHLAAVGDDAVAFIHRFHDRIGYIHIKDYDAASGKFATLGEGTGALDPAACVQALQEHDYAGWWVVEQDVPVDERSPVERARVCRDWMQRHLQAPV
ncbi:MAG: sugar phosphate isomerase/epimerase family protein [Planctomycetota bacterium]